MCQILERRNKSTIWLMKNPRVKFWNRQKKVPFSLLPVWWMAQHWLVQSLLQHYHYLHMNFLSITTNHLQKKITTFHGLSKQQYIHCVLLKTRGFVDTPTSWSKLPIYNAFSFHLGIFYKLFKVGKLLKNMKKWQY